MCASCWCDGSSWASSCCSLACWRHWSGSRRRPRRVRRRHPSRSAPASTRSAVQDLESAAAVDLLDATNAVVASGVADAQGSLLFRQVAAGNGYRVRQDSLVSDPVEVMGPTDHPAQSFYDGITLNQGYGYLPTRDGTTLERERHLPPRRQQGPMASGRRLLGLRPRSTGSDATGSDLLLVPGLRGRGREHARHRLLGWRVRLLRVPPVARRLRHRRGRRRPVVVERRRRPRRHLVSRHQPALRRADPAAAPATRSRRYR